MEMTFDYASSKLFSILETAIYNYEIEVMVEATDGTDPEEAKAAKESKFAGLLKSAEAVFRKVWGWILQAINSIINFIDKAKGPVEVTEDMDIYEGVISFDGKLMQYATELSKGNFTNYDAAIEYFNTLEMNKHLSKGSTVDKLPIRAAMNKYKAAIIRLNNIKYPANAIPDDLNKSQAAIKRAAGLLQSYVKQATKIVNMGKLTDKAKLDKKIAEKQAKVDEKVKKTISKEIKKGNLKPEVVKPEFRNESGIDTEALAQSLLAEAARLIEDAADNTEGIDGGKVLSNDIPEEKPVVDDEYPADDVTGGEGNGSDSEAIKELVDGDAEAMKILTDDKGSTVTESVIIRF